jgi:D-glycero-alpha-D-manno-heptose-7-phosphate kinase
MIIVRTPLRVSFFGGGTDLPSWFKHHGKGAVLSTSIDKYVYLTMRPLPPIFDFKYRVAWRMLEQVATKEEIQHPVIREVLKHYTNAGNDGFEIVYHADLPARSGLGSSSAFTVAALHALCQHNGMATPKMFLAKEAIHVEQELLAEPVGSQDQTAVAFGGLNRIDFHPSGDLSVEPVDISPRRLAEFESHLMLVFTGFTRDAGAIEKSKMENLSAKTAQLNRMYDMVAEGQAILEDRTAPIANFGRLLDQAWRSKKQLSNAVSTGPIDVAYQTAIEAGAYGGKLLGAGGGGFLLFFVAPEKRRHVASALSRVELQPGKRAIEVPIALESTGSTVILHDRQLYANYVSPIPADSGWSNDAFDPPAVARIAVR